jgi:hypothetical protein
VVPPPRIFLILDPRATRVIVRAAFQEMLVRQKKLTVTIDEEVYEGLRTVIGPRKIGRAITTQLDC